MYFQTLSKLWNSITASIVCEPSEVVEALPVKMSESGREPRAAWWNVISQKRTKSKKKKKQADKEFLLRLHPDSCWRWSGKSSVCLKSVRPPSRHCLPPRCWPTSRSVAACRVERNLKSNLRLESRVLIVIPAGFERNKKVWFDWGKEPQGQSTMLVRKNMQIPYFENPKSLRLTELVHFQTAHTIKRAIKKLLAGIKLETFLCLCMRSETNVSQREHPV